MEEQLFYYLAFVPLLGIAAQWLAWRLRLPSILLLLGFGLALGGFGFNPDHLLAELADSDPSFGPKLLLPIVSLSVAIILFEGGLSLRLGELKEAGSVVLRLVTLGALVSWVLTAVAAFWLLGVDRKLAALIGALLVVTGPTVVIPMLRHIRPSRRVGSIVKWEGIVIDPIGAVLAVLVFEQLFIEPGGSSAGGMVWGLLETTLCGGAMGLASAFLLIELVRRYLVPDYLHGVVFLSVTLATFAAGNWLVHESGLVAVTVLGVILANQKSVSVAHVIEFKEHLRVFLISCLFIVLGSRLDLGQLWKLQPDKLWEVTWRGAAFLAALILVVRPAAVFLSTLRTKTNLRERIFLAFLAPRGIVAAAIASVFALQLGSLQLDDSSQALVPVTFLVIIGTVAIYGLLSAPLARRLGLADSNPQGVLLVGAEPWIREIAAAVKESGHNVLLIDTNYRNVAAARMAGLPADCASILSEHVHEETDLSGIGRLLALTSNDEVNALAAREFVHLFGRENVYQLPPWDSGSGRRESIAEHLRGRLLFGEGLNHDVLAHRVELGLQVKTTSLTDEYTFDMFLERYGDSTILLFVVDAKQLTVCTVDQQPQPKSGQSVIALVNLPDKNGAETPADKTDQ